MRCVASLASSDGAAATSERPIIPATWVLETALRGPMAESMGTDSCAGSGESSAASRRMGKEMTRKAGPVGAGHELGMQRIERRVSRREVQLIDILAMMEVGCGEVALLVSGKK
jgi:hypothetical protein